MSQSVSERLLTSNYPATENPTLNERSWVGLDPCSLVGRLAQKIAYFVTAAFQYLASFFTCCSSAEPTRQSENFLHPHLSSYLQRLGIRNTTSLTRCGIFDENRRDELLYELSRRLVYKLIQSRNPTISPSFARITVNTSETFETRINALRQTYRELNTDLDRRHIDVLYNNFDVYLGEDREPCIAFVAQAKELAHRLREHSVFRTCVDDAVRSFSL